MTIKKLLRNTWVPVCLAFAIGLLVGCLATRWHYHHDYEHGMSCGPIDYYDKDGAVRLYSDNSCE